MIALLETVLLGFRDQFWMVPQMPLIMLACLIMLVILSATYYTQNYAGIIAAA